MSNRGAFMPVVAHGELVYVIAPAICAAVTIRTFVRSPLTGEVSRRVTLRSTSIR